jgi:hypothetical protein
MKAIGILFLLLVFLFLLTGATHSPDVPVVDWWVLASGGGQTSTGSSVTINGTLGQPIAGLSNNGARTNLVSGYWGMGWYPIFSGDIYMPLVSR